MRRLAPEVEREVRRLAAKGHKLREIGRILGCSRHAVTNTLRREPLPPSPSAWDPPRARLSLHEREEIRVGLERGDSFTVIAGAIEAMALYAGQSVGAVQHIQPAAAIVAELVGGAERLLRPWA